jgi:hypothetical protein
MIICLLLLTPSQHVRTKTAAPTCCTQQTWLHAIESLRQLTSACVSVRQHSRSDATECPLSSKKRSSFRISTPHGAVLFIMLPRSLSSVVAPAFCISSVIARALHTESTLLHLRQSASHPVNSPTTDFVFHPLCSNFTRFR